MSAIKGQPITSAKQREMRDYLTDKYSLEDALEKYGWHERGARILFLLLAATEGVLDRMEQ